MSSPPSATHFRRCFVVRGTPGETGVAARTVIAALPPDEALWVSRSDDTAVAGAVVEPGHVRALLGRSYQAVVLDLHEDIDADVLGRCHGFVRGGGALVLRMPATGSLPVRSDDSPLVVFPYGAADVGDRFWRRLERTLARSGAVEDPRPLAVGAWRPSGTAEQREVAARLAATFVADEASIVVVQADRGRGKSSALGLALARALHERALRVTLTGPTPDAVLEVQRFMESREDAVAVAYTPPLDVVHAASSPDVIVVDEAAQLPVPLLEELVHRHPRARLAFATTTRGYEGTGRGFVLRFLEWVRRDARPLTELTLEEPIRWSRGDPLERLVFDVLALDAAPAPAASFGVITREATTRAEHVVLDRDAWAADERTLQDLFGLLVHAHYRTTPSDLQRALDAPNLAVHALLLEGRVAAASLVAREGGLPGALSDELLRGQRRIRGHALVDNLVTHCGHGEAGELSMVRSVRIAVHPALRRAGLATRLVDEVHAAYQPDLFGTLFGATPELLRFRRSVGYQLVRVGVSRGNRTGEPAAVMVRPVSARARALTDALRVELARGLPVQLELLAHEGGLILRAPLDAALRAGLPDAPDVDEAELRASVARYARGPQPFEAAAWALARFVRDGSGALAWLTPAERALIEHRVVAREPWDDAARAAGVASVPVAMRAMRRAFRTLLAADGG